MYVCMLFKIILISEDYKDKPRDISTSVVFQLFKANMLYIIFPFRCSVLISSGKSYFLIQLFLEHPNMPLQLFCPCHLSFSPKWLVTILLLVTYALLLFSRIVLLVPDNMLVICLPINDFKKSTRS